MGPVATFYSNSAVRTAALWEDICFVRPPESAVVEDISGPRGPDQPSPSDEGGIDKFIR